MCIPPTSSAITASYFSRSGIYPSVVVVDFYCFVLLGHHTHDTDTLHANARILFVACFLSKMSSGEFDVKVHCILYQLSMSTFSLLQNTIHSSYIRAGTSKVDRLVVYYKIIVMVAPFCIPVNTTLDDKWPKDTEAIFDSRTFIQSVTLVHSHRGRNAIPPWKWWLSVRAMFTTGCWYPLSPKRVKWRKYCLFGAGQVMYINYAVLYKDSIVFSNINTLKL